MFYLKMYFRKVIWLILIFPFFSPSIEAGIPDSTLPPKNIKFEHLTMDDGLSSPIVMDILQDKQGFMWFSTTNGITRFDGYSFKNYLPNPNNPNDPGTVGAAVITGLLIDNKGLFWITTYGGGVDRYDAATDSFIHYKHNPKDPTSIGHNIVQAMFQDKEGNMWFTTIGGGLNRYNRETDSFIRYSHNPDDPDSIGSNKTYFFHEDRQGILWVTVAHGIDRFDRKNNRFIHYRHDANDPHSLPSSIRWAITEDHLGTMWFGGSDGGGFVRYDREKDHFIQNTFDPDDPDSISSNNIRSSFEDSKGTLWIATSGGGVNVYDRVNNRFTSYQHDPNNPHSINHNDIIKIYEDRSGVLWFSTFGNGICRYDHKTERFKQMHHDRADPNSLSHSDVHSIFQDSRGDLWIGTINGLNKYNPETGQFNHFIQETNNPNSLSGNFVKRVTEDAAGFLWIATQGQGLNKFDPVKKSFTHYKKDIGNQNSLAENVCYMVFYDEEHNELWIGHQSQVSKYTISTNTFSHYNTLSFIESIYKDGSGKMWLSGGAGVFAYNREKDTLERIHKQPTPVIVGDKSGNLWIGTVSGLKKYNRNTEELVQYSTEDGLVDNNVVGILDDGGDGLWISTSKGLSHFNVKKETFRNYEIASFNRGGAFLKSASGELFFGGPQGITRFFHHEIVDNVHVPPVVLTSFSKFNQKVELKTPVSNLKLLDLTYQDRVFSFEFAALDYSDPSKNRYKYKLEGFDHNWSEVGSNRRIATYTNLDAGDYLFRVIASNNDGLWNKEGASINIVISPPWWKTLWFKALVGLFVLFIILSMFKYIHKLRFEIKERKNAEEALRDSELLLLSFTEALPDISFIIDEDGRYIKVFATQTDLLFADSEVLEGKKISDILPADVANDFLQIIHDTIATNQSKVYDYKLKIKTGEKWFQARTSPMNTKINGRNAIVWIAFDITDRKQAEEKIRQLSQFQENIIDNANIWLNVLDENANVVIWNKAAENISGYSREEVIGSNEIFLWSYPDEKYRNEINEKAASIIEGEEIKDFETTITSKDGSKKDMSWYSRNVLDDEEKTIGSIALGVDITLRKKAEDALRRAHDELEKQVDERTKDYKIAKEEAELANVAKSEFLANISHELRNPMHQILSYSKYGIDKISRPKEKLLHYFKQTLKSAERLMVLLNGLLDLSKMEAGKMDYTMDYNNVHQIVEEAVSELKPAIKKQKLIVSMADPVSISTGVICDYFKVGQVIRNLISNAIKFTPAEKQIDITFEEDELDSLHTSIPALKVSVCDQGVAIPENELSLVFDKFTQSSKTKTGAGGTGLGLAICKEIVEAHQGKIWAENNPDGGATFNFSLPYEQEVT